MSRVHLFLLVTALVALSPLAAADPPGGQLDPTFADPGANPDGMQLQGFSTNAVPHDDFGSALAEDANGGLWMAGFSKQSDTSIAWCLGLMRFDADGRLDTQSFGPDAGNVPRGKICHVVPGVSPGEPDTKTHSLDIEPLPDGGALVAGVDAPGNFFVCRFDKQGKKQTFFGNGGCLVRPDIGMKSAATAGSPRRLLAVNGEHLFLLGETVPEQPRVMRLDVDSGDIVKYGNATTVPLLGQGSAVKAAMADVAATPDGDLVAVGTIDVDGQNTFSMLITRFDTALGVPDTKFNADGDRIIGFGQDSDAHATALHLSPDGQLLVAGRLKGDACDVGIALAQLRVDTGALVPAFDGASKVTYEPCEAGDPLTNFFPNAVRRTNAHIIVAGLEFFGDASTFVARLHRDGSPDPSFGTAQGMQKIDNLEVGGSFDSAGGSGIVMQGDRIVLGGYLNLQGLNPQFSHQDFSLMRVSGGRIFSDQFETTPP